MPPWSIISESFDPLTVRSNVQSCTVLAVYNNEILHSTVGGKW